MDNLLNEEEQEILELILLEGMAHSRYVDTDKDTVLSIISKLNLSIDLE